MYKNLEGNKYFTDNLKIEKINNAFHKDIIKILNLYYNSFPENELIDFSNFFSASAGDVFSFYGKNEFIGFAALLTKNNISNILYFAIEPEQRSKGYGTQSLKQICNYFRNNRIILDVEDPYKSNNEEEYKRRIKRINFYFKVGFKLTNIKYKWSNEYYIIMINNERNITENEFWDFWKIRE